MTMGDRVKLLREKKGLTQTELAEKIHVGRDTINKWEGGRDINSTYLSALADFFDVSCDYIVRGKSYENTDAMKRTGLSDDAVTLLHSLQENKSSDSIWFADLLCKNVTFLLMCSKPFRSYIAHNQTGIDRENQKASHNEIMECVNAADYQRYKCMKSFEHFLNEVGNQILRDYQDSSSTQRQRKE